MIVHLVPTCPKRAAKFPTATARCSCGYVCSATSEDSNDAALFAHVVACHTVPASDLQTR